MITMNNAKKKASAAIGLGVTTLLTVMAVLLLLSFAMLSLLSANSDAYLSEKAAQSVKDYYAADCQAETWWINLKQTAERTDDTTVAERLSNAGFESVFTDGDYIIRNAFFIGENRNLMVCAAVSENGKARILLWQSMPVYRPSP